MLARIFSRNGIGFVQVDGRNPVMDRTALLSRLCGAPDIRVLLISINTGAVGYVVHKRRRGGPSGMIQAHLDEGKYCAYS